MRPPTFLSFIILAAVMAAWTIHTVHGQISVGCFQNQLDSSTGASDIKSYQDIYMSQGACTNYCRTSGTAYALTMDGSACHCSNSAPVDSNKIDDAKCDKPCMGYPFEMCGGSSSRSIANVLLIGSSTAVPGGAGGGGSTSTSNGTGAATTAPTASESSKKSQNSNSSNNSNGGGNGASTTTTTTDNNGGKAFNTDTDSSSGSGGESSPGIIAASIAAIFGFAGLFAVAFQQQQYDPHLPIEQNLNHKEPLQASPPPPQLAPSFSRGPQSLQQGPPLPSGAIEHIRDNSEDGDIEEENYERHDERSLSHHPSVRSIRHDRQERGSVDSTANILRVVNTDDSHTS
ncbi:hypothetical protein KI688_011522 [Linnemannia hyalina]|uniref:WSC domain-containing protein n=1 Tax=Linnemannia hyalina TaxID=64524 RepID=A0A9P8BUA5_9FUNG|nr:hypothetical protein KI688_011522 [Linnemannia hyalina]